MTKGDDVDFDEVLEWIGKVGKRFTYLRMHWRLASSASAAASLSLMQVLMGLRDGVEKFVIRDFVVSR